ncbi:hypothetical protein LWI29_029520 [Acer saccharum]|uniref:Uncharacterized protein n=1 Tax=Acer saccharum TaxID=4024 RepID=A0AA39SXM8_ACESA|nr:hypothetical protein LWI29_029520 [Acer saccharum]KAK1576144.1 hypothetical protein Q3G72_011260 [Acer saccharum]
MKLSPKNTYSPPKIQKLRATKKGRSDSEDSSDDHHFQHDFSSYVPSSSLLEKKKNHVSYAIDVEVTSKASHSTCVSADSLRYNSVILQQSPPSKPEFRADGSTRIAQPRELFVPFSYQYVEMFLTGEGN